MNCLIDTNMTRCTCTYEPCPRKGRCCECVEYHRKGGELPGCFFPPDIEKTYDRSNERFVKEYRTRNPKSQIQNSK